MNDRKVIRSKTRAVRRLAECRSCEEDETDTSGTTESDYNNGSPPTVRHGGKCRGAGGYCSDSAVNNHTVYDLPPIGVFWDIENCQIPRGKSAVAVAQVIRDQFFNGYRESEFCVVCDVKRESPQVVQELDNAQVNVIHVGSQSKNAADEKLRQTIRRFADIHGAKAAIVLISGDINYAPDLCDLRHRKKIHVILVHNDNCSESLILCANETYKFSELVAGLPLRAATKTIQPAEVTVSGLPINTDPGKVRARLKRLAENCGGRVGLVAGSLATVRFPSVEFAFRAQKRMNREDVFGSQINVSYPSVVSSRRPVNDLSPSKNIYRRTFSNTNRNEDKKVPAMFEDPRGLLKTLPDPCSWKTLPPFTDNGAEGLSNGVFKQPFPPAPLCNQENVPNSVNSKFNESSWENIPGRQPSFGRPILGRQNGSRFFYEQKTNESYSNGRHSLDSMLDFEVEREARERERRSNETFENWLRNSISNQESRRCHTPSPTSVLGVNTSIPPPPIVNLPRRNESNYFFHPIDTYNNLTNGHQLSSPSSASSNDASEFLRCSVHSRVQSGDCSLTNVTVRLSDFSARLMALVTSHDNKLPLTSLRDCYEAQFEMMTSDAHSVPMEHLVTCACSIELVKSPNGKYLRLTTNVSPTFPDPQTLGVRLVQFSKEIQDLLKNEPKCQMPFDQVVPAYYRAYGRHCRISDYGCTKLIRLLEKLPHIVQVIGEGLDRMVTLSHRAQMQRFTADLTRVLRSRGSQQLTVSELPQLWLKNLGRILEPTEYGLCFLEDLLDLVPTSSVVMNGEVVSLNRKQWPAVQEQYTNQFVLKVVELLSTEPDFTMEVSKFSPAFHHHFGVQCKLSDYGFTKLVDLFEAIPHVVTIEGEMEGGRRVSLTIPERLKVLSSRVVSLVQPRYPPGLFVEALLCAYLWEYGHALKPENFGCNSPLELVNKLPTVEVVTNVEGIPLIIPAVNEAEKTGNHQQNYSSQPKVSMNEVKIDHYDTKTNGAATIQSSVLFNLLKKAQNSSTTENGVSSTDLYNQLKPLAAPEPAVTLLSPAEFLLPAANSKSPTTLNLFPSSPDPSVLPKPVRLTVNQVSNGFEFGNNLLEDFDLNEQNRHKFEGKQRVKLAPQFCSPLQLK